MTHRVLLYPRAGMRDPIDHPSRKRNPIIPVRQGPRQSMNKPVTPLVGTDPFVVDGESRVCPIQRADNGLWALPGGMPEFGETPKQCAEREFMEEAGYRFEATHLLGVFSSTAYGL